MDESTKKLPSMVLSAVSEFELLAEFDADRFHDGGQLGDYYICDERDLETFESIVFSTERDRWVARFIAPPGKPSALEYSEATYVEVLNFARLLHHNRIKPSESFRALAHLDAMLDRAVSLMGSRCSSNL